MALSAVELVMYALTPSSVPKAMSESDPYATRSWIESACAASSPWVGRPRPPSGFWPWRQRALR